MTLILELSITNKKSTSSNTPFKLLFDFNELAEETVMDDGAITALWKKEKGR